jgi:GAF domain-containing protein
VFAVVQPGPKVGLGKNSGALITRAGELDVHCSTPKKETLLEPTSVLVIEDATQDSRFNKSPLVLGLPFIRFYAGVPIVTADAARAKSADGPSWTASTA